MLLTDVEHQNGSKRKVESSLRLSFLKANLLGGRWWWGYSSESLAGCHIYAGERLHTAAEHVDCLWLGGWDVVTFEDSLRRFLVG